MNYGFLIFGELDRGALATAFAEMLSLAPEAVDVALEDAVADRDWEAAVLCTVSPVAGEFHWYLDVYLGVAVAGPPSESVAGSWLAARLKTVVAWESQQYPPSAFWLVGPDGRRTRARIYEEDSDDDLPTVYQIDAVEHPVAALPGLPVAPLPEVIREHRMPTPVRDRLVEELGPGADRNMTMWLGGWESVVSRLAQGWPPDGWYPADYYREDLQIRDELTTAVEALPEAARALGEVDARFVELTEDDGGRALAAETGPLPPDASDRWWWRRVPDPLPWRDAPVPG
ncbi:hypothetical protein [Paractinoplanes lichenicola]|uniref:Uncharacterized protein n=1 Tax=Paractinoplanes lichenicola TaxID=2802976 RepID=A0ABS1W5R5_9ACTN|nr:hypothetical protein [Actinoplanes lichenicola]MBL7262076.1 hypothetical protein [Actinoplanes lichenicola]